MQSIKSAGEVKGVHEVVTFSRMLNSFYYLGFYYHHDDSLLGYAPIQGEQTFALLFACLGFPVSPSSPSISVTWNPKPQPPLAQRLLLISIVIQLLFLYYYYYYFHHHYYYYYCCCCRCCSCCYYYYHCYYYYNFLFLFSSSLYIYIKIEAYLYCL